MSYNYNLNKDIQNLKYKIQKLQEVQPFVNKCKQQVINNKIRDLLKQIKQLER